MFNIKTIIIVVVIVALGFVGYGFLISGKKKESASGVTKQAVNTTSTASQSSSTGLDGPGKEFVTQLLAIQNIKFNLQLFSDPVFEGLQDWSRDIEEQETGRPNPFAPLDGDTNSQARLSAGFNGSIGSGAGAFTSESSVTGSSTRSTAVSASSTQTAGQSSTRPTTQTRTINTTTR